MKTALVTGANKGIGFEVARQLARKHFHVFIGARNVNAGRAAAEKLRGESEGQKQFNDVEFLEIDVSNAASVGRAAEEFSKRAGEGGMEAVFIRAPIIRRTGPGVRVLAEYQGDPVLVEQGKHLVATFHPELTSDPRVHQLFLSKL